MTAKEAINLLTLIPIDYVHINLCSSEPEATDKMEAIDVALNMAISALKKQIPMVPINQNSVDASCPACDSEVVPFEFFTLRDYYPDYCPKCGQALDWSGCEWK